MLKKSTRIRLGQLQKSESKLVFNTWKWRSIACLNELLEEQETAEDGKKLKSVTVDGRKTLDDGQYGSEEQQETKGFGDSTGCGWMQGILGLRFGGPLPWRRSQSKSNFWRRRRQAMGDLHVVMRLR